MKSKLSIWTMNTKKWRKENGCATPEWKMYVENRQNTCMVIMIIAYFIGVLVGVSSPL